MIERDISRSERAEADLDAFISKRHEQKVKMEGERLEEAVWVETSRREEMDLDRLDWHRHLVGVHAERMKYHSGIVNALESREKTDEGRKAS